MTKRKVLCLALLVAGIASLLYFNHGVRKDIDILIFLGAVGFAASILAAVYIFMMGLDKGTKNFPVDILKTKGGGEK